MFDELGTAIGDTINGILNNPIVQLGIRAVPSVIVNDKYLIQGGQPVAVFEQALRKIAAE